jgi:hypothetical protein
MPKKPRPRAKRRETERAGEKLKAARERLFQLEPGGSPERPLSVASAAVVEAHAESVPCPYCQGKHELVEHVAVTVSRVRLREARLRCRQCGTRRSLWFRIDAVGPN